MSETLLDSLVVAIRADTRSFTRDIDTMRVDLENVLGVGADAAGRRLEDALGRFVRTGKFSFDDLRRYALSALAEIADSIVRSSLASIFGPASGGHGGLFSGLAALTGSLLGLPGRATGGDVVAGRPYRVGEAGPEIFVPTGSGRIEPVSASQRTVNITINMAGGPASDPQMMQRSARQMAGVLRRTLDRIDL